ncbi:hypothetical protein CTAYLR_004457 [Chrysophaeum taylorii]|uniref:Calpain catalytic domain-containing protein n=1 Tax=Chrysophaeum taylorii TaxID=2483200 RepID=A0AAD7XHR7_9STRA|nr:hypothetical protein CTAYLR_004457 [Chrysophaeum taylorii]
MAMDDVFGEEWLQAPDVPTSPREWAIWPMGAEGPRGKTTREVIIASTNDEEVETFDSQVDSVSPARGSTRSCQSISSKDDKEEVADELRLAREEIARLQELRRTDVEAVRRRARAFFDDVVTKVRKGIQTHAALERRYKKVEKETKGLRGEVTKLENIAQHLRQELGEARAALDAEQKKHRETDAALARARTECVELRRLASAARDAERLATSRVAEHVAQYDAAVLKYRGEITALEERRERDKAEADAREMSLRDQARVAHLEVANERKVRSDVERAANEFRGRVYVLEDQLAKLRAREDERVLTEIGRTREQLREAQISIVASLSPSKPEEKAPPEPETPPKHEKNPKPKLEEIRSLLADGLELVKHGRSGYPKRRIFYLRDDELWWSSSGKDDDAKSFPLKGVSLQRGKVTSTLSRRAASKAPTAHCFSLIRQQQQQQSPRFQSSSGGRTEFFEVMEELREALRKASDEVVRYVEKLVSKILLHPADPKFRRLKTTSAIYRERFGSREAEALLSALGFEREHDRFAMSDVRVSGLEEAQQMIEARLAAPQMDDDDEDLARAVAMSKEGDASKDDELARAIVAMSTEPDGDLERALAMSKESDESKDDELAWAIAMSTEPDGDLERALAMSKESDESKDDELARAIAMSTEPDGDLGRAIATSKEEEEDPKVRFERRVAQLFESLRAAGKSPNEAAAEALSTVQREFAQAKPVSTTTTTTTTNPPRKKRTSELQRFERMDTPEAVGDDNIEMINVLYKEEGITFVDPSFPPAPASVFGDEDPNKWTCVACQARNPIPERANSKEGILRLIEERRRNQLSEIACGTCGRRQPLLEVGLRPSRWLRPVDIRDDLTMQTSTVPWTLFRDEPRPDDLRQGGLGNCWFVCALSVLAEVSPERLRKRFELSPLYNPAGAYRIRLNQEGVWRTVTVDDSLPVNALDTAAYLKPSRRSLWGPLLEKAAAKLHGSYVALAGGTFAEAFNMLTGMPVKRIQLDRYSRDGGAAGRLVTRDDPQSQKRDKLAARFDERYSEASDATLELFAQLYSFRESRFAVGASTFVHADDGEFEAEMRSLGLQTRHAYGVLDARQYEDELLVKLRNPNGVALWRGAYSQPSPHARSELGLDKEDQGVFWMRVSDFAKYFVELTVCRLVPESYLDARAAGWLASRFGAGDAVCIDVYSRTSVEVAVHQEAHARRGEEAEHTAVDLGLAVVKLDQNRSLVASSKRMTHRAGATCDATFEQDDLPTTYLVVPLCFGHVASTEPRKFNFAVHSSQPAIVVRAAPLDARVLARAVIHLALKFGDKQVLLRNQLLQQDALVFYNLDDEAGYCVVAENRAPTTVVVAEVDGTEHTKGFVSTRGALATRDIIPPRTRMILCILSREPGVKDFSLALAYGASVQPPAPPDATIPHIPSLDHLDQLRALHEPIPLPPDQGSPRPPAHAAGGGGVDAFALASALNQAMNHQDYPPN